MSYAKICTDYAYSGTVQVCVGVGVLPTGGPVGGLGTPRF